MKGEKSAFGWLFTSAMITVWYGVGKGIRLEGVAFWDCLGLSTGRI